MKSDSAKSQPRVLKPEQKTAAHTLDRHLSVTAGPGAGKTFVLVERYLEILRTQKVSVDNIVAITFTNRAANEMRERVRTTIDNLLRTTAGDERKRWLRHKRALEGAVITTIHGLCSRLLHEFPVEANIDPQFVLLDEHQAVMLLEAAVEESLTNAIHHGYEKIVQLTQGAGRSALARALLELYWKYRGEGLSLSRIERLSAANHATESDYTRALKELDTAMADLISVRGLSRGAEEKRSRIAQGWPGLRAILTQTPNEQMIGLYCQAIEDFREWRPSKGKGTTSAVERVDELLWGSKSGDRVRGKVPTLGFDLLARDYALALLKLLREIDDRLDAEKQRLSVVDFDDLQLRTLKLLNDHPEVMSRVAERYRFFLVDEFQDTNGLQRDLMTRLGMMMGANLFIVGDRKQSIYGFRGADVDVFREMSAEIEAAGGQQVPLHLNFRSQKPLIDSLNFLFERIFHARAEIPAEQLGQLGYVEHEPGIPERGVQDQSPLVEFLVSILPDAARNSPDESDDDSADDQNQPNVRERDAEQLVERINALVSAGGAGIRSAVPKGGQDARAPFSYGDIAILFRALTGVWVYESALRRAGIPYLTVQGKGFYHRVEITDLIQLLRFLDNTTDELALAAVLRSPLCGISDNALLALRCGPKSGGDEELERLHRRHLWPALRSQSEVQFIDDEERADLDRASAFLDAMVRRRNRCGIAELLRQAVTETEFMTVISANFDGAHRIGNVEKLFRLAEQFEKTGANLIRDFVNYVEEFDAVGGRESEGQMDKSADVVRLMTIHQAKGLEFPVVIIPDLHREPIRRDAPFILDRRRGLSLRVPDGRGQMVRGAFLDELQKRAGWREEFESMRVLYVGATRAEDRLIFSGAVPRKAIKNLCVTEREQGLAWIWQALELDEYPQSEVKQFGDDVRIDVRIDRDAQSEPGVVPALVIDGAEKGVDISRPFTELFPLLRPIAPEPGRILRRFSVTQLINFQRCARQYYFDRMLRAPGAEELAAWNDAEAPEPPANLTATLKGAVIHRFCETFADGDDPEERLRASFADVTRQRQAELAGRVFDIDTEQAVRDLTPLARNYLASDVFKRVTAAQRLIDATVNSQFAIRNSTLSSPGLWSELRFRLRRSLGILTGTIDKLLITPAASGDGFDVEIIDFKTNRFRAQTGKRSRTAVVASSSIGATGVIESGSRSAQGLFDFEAPQTEGPPSAAAVSLAEQIDGTARDYQLQMQAYALALRELLPTGTRLNSLRATLHFIDPNVERSVSSALLDPETCVRAIDEAMRAITSLDGTLDAEAFPPLPATHCRMCNFRDLCVAGQDWLRQNR
ncbi:MAG TPA: UvrD-helicase domain-containing protein [Pyrinomonadaceae bacterium]|nr:UvrD-helicase domain-containing protein [Pyrinomonadaceae bacterium]